MMTWILLGLGYLFMVFALATEIYFEFYRMAARRLSPKEKKVSHFLSHLKKIFR